MGIQKKMHSCCLKECQQEHLSWIEMIDGYASNGKLLETLEGFVRDRDEAVKTSERKVEPSPVVALCRSSSKWSGVRLMYRSPAMVEGREDHNL